MYIHILKSKDGAKQIMQFSDFKGMPFVGDPVYWEREALYAVDVRKMLAAILTQRLRSVRRRRGRAGSTFRMKTTHTLTYLDAGSI